jgi:hypothetical protein
MPLDLLVPDLLSPDTASPRLRSLEKWLARADIERNAAGGLAWLARAFGLGELPVAAIECSADPAPGAWMRADPVHLRIQGDAVHLYDSSALQVTPAEALELIAALQSHFASDGLEFTAPSPDRWYVRMPAGEAPRTTPLAEAKGRNVFGLLPADGRWRVAMTEAQMILSSHEVNTRRESEGKLAINSTWFWGAGALPEAAAKPYSVVYADDALARGLGTWSGARVTRVPRGIKDVELERAEDAILVALHDATRLDADERWFAALGTAIDKVRSRALVLPAPSHHRRHAHALGALALVRSSRPLAAYA